MIIQNDIGDEVNVTTAMSLSEEQKEVLRTVNVPDSLDINIADMDSLSKDTVQIMNDAFGFTRNMYENVLSPQLTENEDLKRRHKIILMSNLFEILKWQFIFTYVFVFALIIGTLASHWLNISEVIVKDIIKFVEFYITSIVVELLSILFFIVKNVFDKSIVDLIRNFDKHENKGKSHKKQEL